jgi:PAS domain S-box-containing protein
MNSVDSVPTVDEDDAPATEPTVHVLHVDDSSDLLEVVSSFLERELDDAVVHTATDAETALERLASVPVDCIVSDYRMPDADGLELFGMVRKRNPDVPFILFTGKGSEAIASEAISAGVTDYLQKGTDADQYAVLANRIENAVGRHSAERAHAEMARRYATLINNLPGIVYRCGVADPWPMEYVAGDCRTLTGYTAAQLDDGEVRWAEDVIHPEDRADVRMGTLSAVDERERYVLDYRLVTKGGETKWVQSRGQGVFDGGELVALEGYIVDQTPQKRRQRMLERHNQHLEEFACAVSHTLRNPLQVAINGVEMLPDDVDGEQIERVDRSLTRMEVLIEKLLTLARRGRVVSDPVPTDLADISHQAWRNVATEQASLRVETDQTVAVEPARMQEVLEHLFRNAIQHAGPDVTVTVGDLPSGFYVADDGPGIPDGQYEDIFQPGYSTESCATGFGLDIIESIVAAHGWEIVATDSEAGGARFEMRRADLF